MENLAEGKVSLRGPSPIPYADPGSTRFGLLLVHRALLVTLPCESVSKTVSLVQDHGGRTTGALSRAGHPIQACEISICLNCCQKKQTNSVKRYQDNKISKNKNKNNKNKLPLLKLFLNHSNFEIVQGASLKLFSTRFNLLYVLC